MKRRKGPYPEDSQAYQQAAAEDREQRLEAIRRGIKRDDDLLAKYRKREADSEAFAAAEKQRIFEVLVDMVQHDADVAKIKKAAALNQKYLAILERTAPIAAEHARNLRLGKIKR